MFVFGQIDVFESVWDTEFLQNEEDALGSTGFAGSVDCEGHFGGQLCLELDEEDVFD